MSTRRYLALLGALCLAFALSLAVTSVAGADEELEPIVPIEALVGPESPNSVAFDAADQTVLVSDNEEQECNCTVRLFSVGTGASQVGEINGKAGSQETPQGGFEFEQPSPPGFGASGVGDRVAVDQQGEVYVSDSAHRVIDKFAPIGAASEHEYQYVCQFSGVGRGCVAKPEGSTFGRTAGLAVDAKGNLYVADPENSSIDEFDAAGGDVEQISTSEHPALGSPPTSLAVSADGSRLFIEDPEHAPNAVRKREVVELRRGPTGAVLGESVVAKLIAGMAFDRESSRLLLQERGRVAEYDPATASVTRVIPDSSSSSQTASRGGLAVAEPAGAIYLIEEVPGLHVELLAVPPATPPTVQDEPVADVTPDSAQLRATIDPHLRTTHFVFQWGIDRSYAGGEVPLPSGGTVEGLLPIASVSAQLEGLLPGSTYHYRLLATNHAGSTPGPDETFTTYSVEPSGLPDGRAYELVSPLDKNGGSILPAAACDNDGCDAFQAAADGGALAYASKNAFAEPQANLGVNPYIAVRQGDRWDTQNVTPPSLNSSDYGVFPHPVKSFSRDLARMAFHNGENFNLPRLNPPLPGTTAPPHFDDFYLADIQSSTYRSLLSAAPEHFTDLNYLMGIEGSTPDLRHIVVASGDPRNGGQLEEFSEATGALVPVSVPANPLAPGETLTGAVLGSGGPAGTHGAPHAISDDGTRVFWSLGASGGEQGSATGSEPVFLRENPAAPESPRDSEGRCTVAADACTRELPPGEFLDASSTGSKVLLGTGEIFDVDAMRPLVDLTAGMGGFVGELGASQDLSIVYFVDTAVLPGAGTNGFGATAKGGEQNLYVYREGSSPRFIATLAAAPPSGISPDLGDWANNGPAGENELAVRTTRVNAAASALVFDSVASLTGYDNRDAATAQPDSEIYEYTMPAPGTPGPGTLSCVSCRPTGQPPTAGAAIPAGTDVEKVGYVNGRSYYQPRALSSSGAVFFDSSESLVGGDTNGVQDVYEYENGHARLISSGTGGAAAFLDASESGGDVFFTTANQLVSADTDQLVDVYDARVGGGFPVGETAPACTGTGCQGVPAAQPIFATPSSGTFNGIGNFPAGLTTSAAKQKAKKTVKCAKGKKLAHGKCVKNKKKAKAKKARRAKRAGSNRRAHS